LDSEKAFNFKLKLFKFSKSTYTQNVKHSYF